MRNLPGWAFLVGIVALVGATALCSVGAFVFAQQFAVDLGESGVQVASFSDFLGAQPTITPSPTNAPPTATPRPGDTPVPTPLAPTATLDPLAGYTWDDPRRVNILLMGIDQRQGETGSFRTDTMIVFSVDPARKTVGMLSIPRDLWVQIPGYQPNRINVANDLGDAGGYPGGGPALAARTVEENLGITIDKYVRINFDVFERVINIVAPNGVEVCPEEEIDDPDYPDAGYGFIAVHFDAGCQRLDATRLLQYARTRATEGGDFDRAARQQEVIRAVRDEVLSAGGIVNLIGQVPQLYNELSGSYVTNLTLEEIISLGVLATEIPQDGIRSGVINERYVRFETSVNGDQVLVPLHGALRELFQEVFNSGSSAPQPSTADLRQRADQEAASIVVFNNAGVAGLAGQTRDWLIANGVRVAGVGDMPNADDAPTYIRVYGDGTNTARYLASVLNIPESRIQPVPPDGLTDADVMLVVGSDIQPLLGGE